MSDDAGHYKPGDPAPAGYLQWHEWAEVQARAGLRQTQCGACSRWLFPQEREGHVCEEQGAMSITEKTDLGGAMTVINPQHPIMKAWLAYKQTEGYKNTLKWAAIEEHRDGSLWSAFLEGYQSAVAQPTRKTDDEIRAKIAEFQASVEEEEANGGAGGDDWMEAMTAQRWLKWVLGE